MNPKLRTVLIAIGVMTLLVLGIFVVPRGLSLYFQIRGGQQIEYVLRFEEGINELLCEQISPSNGTNRQEVKTAKTDLNRAILLNKDNSQAYFYLGRANCLLGNPAESIENFEQYTQIRPNNPLGNIGLGFAYEQLGDISAAGRAWKSAELTVEDFNQAGDEEFRADNYNNAIIWYERALLVDSNSADTWLNIGKVYDAMQDYEKALDAYRQAWENDPELSTAALVDSYKRNGDINSVKDVLEHMLEKYPDSFDRVLWFQELGSSYLSQVDYDQAVELYSEALIEFEKQPDLYISLGWALYERGDGFEAAKNEFLKAINVNDSNGAGYFALGQLLVREDKLSEADIRFEMAIERNPDNRWWYVRRANVLREAGNNNEALIIYQKGIDLFPEFSANYYQISLIYLLSDEPEKAIDSIETAIAIMEKSDDRYYVRAGQIFESVGEIEKAKISYINALQIDPNNNLAFERLLQIKDK